MLNHPPSLRHLQYLSALDQTGHFGRAAQKCFVTQSTLSAGIAELESQLELILVERINKRNIKLTPLAKDLAEKGRKLIEEANQWVEYAQQKDNPLSVTLKVGIIPTIAPFLIPSLLKKVKKKYPHLTLDIREVNSHRMLTLLNQGELDLGLLALPYPIGNLKSEVLFDDEFYVALPKDNKLSKRKAISSKDLKSESLLLLEEGHCLTDHALKLCQMSYDKRVAGSSLFTLIQLVNSGFGLTLVPSIARKGLANFSKKVVFIKFSEKAPHRQITLLSRESWKNSQAKNAFGVLVQEAAKEL